MNDAANPAPAGLGVAVAIVLHRWKHPTYRMGEQGCRCERDAAMAVEMAQPELAANPAPAGPLTCAGCGDYIAGEFYHSECQRGLARAAPAAEEA